MASNRSSPHASSARLLEMAQSAAQRIPRQIVAHWLQFLDGETIARSQRVAKSWKLAAGPVEQKIFQAALEREFDETNALVGQSWKACFASRVLTNRNWRAGKLQRFDCPDELNFTSVSLVRGQQSVLLSTRFNDVGIQLRSL